MKSVQCTNLLEFEFHLQTNPGKTGLWYKLILYFFREKASCAKAGAQIIGGVLDRQSFADLLNAAKYSLSEQSIR